MNYDTLSLSHSAVAQYKESSAVSPEGKYLKTHHMWDGQKEALPDMLLWSVMTQVSLQQVVGGKSRLGISEIVEFHSAVHQPWHIYNSLPQAKHHSMGKNPWLYVKQQQES